MSDGDILLSDGSEIDYDCGWKTLRVNIQGLSQSVDYDGDYCTNEDEVIDDEFCSTSAKNGRIWIGTSIIGILLLSASIPVILSKHKKIGGKDSWIFFAICIAGGLFLNIATFYWFFNDKCEDIEQYNNSDTNEEAQFDTSPGPSLYLMGIASFFSIAVTLINVLHICNKVDKQNFGHQSNSSQIPEQPRIQTHIVTATTINHN